MFQKNATRWVGALEASHQKDALEAEGYGHDGGEEVELGAILVDAQFRPGLIAIDVARIRAELREAGAHRAADGEVRQHPRHWRPNPFVRGCLWRWGRSHLRVWKFLASRIDLLPSVPSPPERLRCAAVRDHDLHGQAARCCSVAQRRRRHDSFYRRKELDILLQCQSSHEDRARVDLLMRRLRRKLGKEIHRTHEYIVPQKRIKGEDSFPLGSGLRTCVKEVLKGSAAGGTGQHKIMLLVGAP